MAAANKLVAHYALPVGSQAVGMMESGLNKSRRLACARQHLGRVWPSDSDDLCPALRRLKERIIIVKNAHEKMKFLKNLLRKQKRLELRYVPYSEGDKLVREGWTIAKEEDKNQTPGFVYLERLDTPEEPT